MFGARGDEIYLFVVIDRQACIQATHRIFMQESPHGHNAATALTWKMEGY